MNDSKGKKKFRLSLKWQIAIALTANVLIGVLICIIMNTTLLEKFYISHKEDVLRSAYNMINNSVETDNYDYAEIELEIQRICETYNISMIVIDEATDTVMASMNDTDIMVRILLDHLFGYNIFGSTEKILEIKDDYTLQISPDMRNGDQYLEMWGLLNNGDLFLIRSSITGIEDNVYIINRFFIYISIVIAIVSVLIAIVFSKQISRPIMELADISEKMSDLDFDVKYTGNVSNEIGILGDNINDLSNKLETTISELKTANNELQSDLDRKTKIDEMRQEFLSNVSHELKTPIALVQGYAEGLKDCVNDDAESRDFYCDVIIDEASKMNTMVKKLLTLNQIEFGTEAIVLERFDIDLMIKNCIQSSDILIKQHEAVIRYSQNEPVMVWGDEFKAEEVFLNYLTNALNHINEERIIDIAIRKMDNGKVRISVFNTGDPIPEESIDYIWDKFYKVDKARTREYGGSGVGLSIVKAIQESLNQNYGVINYNNGVEFYFELDGNELINS